MKLLLVSLAVCASVCPAWAQTGRAPSHAARARDAQNVVLARVVEVQPRFETNRHGDRLIVSGLVLEVEETWKGPHQQIALAAIEGGSIGSLTLRVSDMPTLREGDRAVFFLDRGASGEHVPHGRGAGVLKLGADARVVGTGETVDEVRRAVRAVVR
jgi:hypothetical protein